MMFDRRKRRGFSLIELLIVIAIILIIITIAAPKLNRARMYAQETAAMGAIFARENSGKGQHVDVSEAQVWATLHTGNQESSFIMHGMKRMR